MTLRGNLDAPEAALDALLQSAVCLEVSWSLMWAKILVFIPQNVGWRDGSLRIVMILTDAGFKTALDGKVLFCQGCYFTHSPCLSVCLSLN